MNKKEISEIKRLLHPDRCPITRICGCYVNNEKEKVATMKEAFLSLPDEEVYKYYEILKKSLSGTIGKNLLNMEFPLSSESEGGAQNYLLSLKESKLKDDALLDEFYDKVIENFLYPENYYIVLVHCAYDIPQRTSDGIEMTDASDYVYEYLLCSICPVKLSKPGLSYNEETNSISERIRDWFVEPPVSGFLFPAFNDRNTDIHSLLYYSKNPEELNSEFARNLFGCEEMPMTASSQKDTFNSLIADTLKTECTFETVKSIHENLGVLIEEHKDDPEPIALDKQDVKRLLMECVDTKETLESFDEDFERSAGDDRATLYVSNVASTRKFEVKTPNIVIQVKPECADLIETRILEGRTCFVIPVNDEVEVNGIPIHMPAINDDSEE